MKSFNAINYSVFSIPGYIFFVGIGSVFSISIWIILLYEKGYSLQKNMHILLVSIICAILSARFFGCLSGIYRDIGMNKNVSWDSLKNTGIVYYGGLIGLLVSYSMCSKWLKQDIYVMDILAVIIPIFHSIARLGCFVGGCCFGKINYCRIAIEYTNIELGQTITAKRIPTQLIEAVFNLGIFIYALCLVQTEEWKEKNILRQYLFIYSVFRFMIEFIRGDIARGVIYGVSFSQVISAIIWIYLILTIYQKFNRQLSKEG